MNSLRRKKQVAQMTDDYPYSSDSYEEFDDDYILINEKINEVKWVCNA